jgi:branched-chain amino acid transport system ATP-binding protein
VEAQPIIQTKRLSKNFGALRAVNDVDLKVYPGQIHSIIGPNGAGKTTLFNLLTGFLSPTSGKISFKGSEITYLPSFVISRLGIGRSFQITSIFPDLTVFENIWVALQSRTKANYNFIISLRGLRPLEEKTMQILQRIGLADKKAILARNLSHGEKRILDIGIGLSIDPSLLLLDEPASGLTGEEISRVIKLVKGAVGSVTIVLIEHNIDVVLSISDRITVLHQGSVIAEDYPDKIKKNPKVQEAYLGGY